MKNLRMPGPRKLQPRYIGPYKILTDINPATMRLDLPLEMQIYPEFHTSLLKVYDPLSNSKSPPPPVSIEGELEYEVRRILDSRRYRGKLQYLIDWVGYAPEDRSWEPAEHVHAPLLVHRFHALNPTKPLPINRPLGGRTVTP